jgi:diacylglycerol kinase (ATP)
MMQNSKPERTHGLKHFFAATTYSVAGLKTLLREAAFRQEMALAPIGCVLLWLFAATALECLVFGILLMLLIAAEALNTAIERIVDHLTQDWAQFAKEAKDLGSLAVMCVLICHVMLLVHVVVW